MSDATWLPIPLAAKLFTNLPETAITRAHAAIENCFATEADGLIRFPGLRLFKDLGGGSRQVLYENRGDMIAIGQDDGAWHRVDKNAAATNVTGVPLAGGRRPIAVNIDDRMVAAGGGQIVQFNGETTRVLSDDAPLSTHVGYVNGFLLATEVDSGRFQHADALDPQSWDPLDTFAANGSPDNIDALMVTPFREILLAGRQSVEQFERLPSGDPPFFLRWSVGQGVHAPYTLCFADNSAWAVDASRNFVRFSGQVTQSIGDDVNRQLEETIDWTDAWAAPLDIIGQKFIIVQAPRAMNPHGTEGLTLVHDLRQRKFFALYGWDAGRGRQVCWPGYSVLSLWGRHFVGGAGKIYELTTDTHGHAGGTAKMLFRTAHLSELGEVSIDALRMRLRRGTGTYETAPQISIRVNRDNAGFGRWVRKSLGKTGQRSPFVEFGSFGNGHTFQFEVEVTDDCPVEIVKFDAQVTPLGN